MVGSAAAMAASGAVTVELAAVIVPEVEMVEPEGVTVAPGVRMVGSEVARAVLEWVSTAWRAIRV
jgi:lipid A disaccharide synthetase